MWRLSLAVAGALGWSSATEPPMSNFIRRVDPIEYKVQLIGSISEGSNLRSSASAEDPLMVFYVPFIVDGAYSTIDQDHLDEYLPDFKMGNREQKREFQLVRTGGPWEYMKIATPYVGRSDLEFRIVEYITSYSAEIDDADLSTIDWPQNWPMDVQAALKPQMYIDSNNQQVVDLMNRWTAGKPKSVSPYFLAKELARQVKQYYQINGNGVWSEGAFYDTNRRDRGQGEITGLKIEGALEAIRTRRGSIHDLVCLYVAVCRAAGLPARPVIGIDSDSETTSLISWAEFYVPTAGWVSVDVRQMYWAPGPMSDINNKWAGFGTDDDLNERIALAYFYHAPLIRGDDLSVERPMLWSWSGYPRLWKATEQTMRIKIDHAPRRASDSK